jgi:hypothetical protein
MPAQTTFLGGGVPSGSFAYGDGFATAQLTPAEMRMRDPFPYPALEELRRRCLQAVVDSNVIEEQCRAVATFAHQTELHAVFNGLLENAGLERQLTTRRKMVAIDRDLAITQSLEPAFMSELAQLHVPSAYLELLSRQLSSTSFRYRVACRCAVTLLAAILLAETGS